MHYWESKHIHRTKIFEPFKLLNGDKAKPTTKLYQDQVGSLSITLNLDIQDLHQLGWTLLIKKSKGNIFALTIVRIKGPTPKL